MTCWLYSHPFTDLKMALVKAGIGDLPLVGQKSVGGVQYVYLEDRDITIGLTMYKRKHGEYRIRNGNSLTDVPKRHSHNFHILQGFELSFHPKELLTVVTWLIPHLFNKVEAIPEWMDPQFNVEIGEVFSGYAWSKRGWEMGDRGTVRRGAIQIDPVQNHGASL